jgi:RNA polymerase sigma factor (sigma-70 family)
MRDSEVVASIVAGDPRGLAIAYDRYAAPLYKYCRTLLNDPADAADAVQDAFVIAASRLDGLRDPNRLRAWLYAVARNEALRILRSHKGKSALDEAPEVTDDSVEVGHDAERADLRALLEDASSGLNPGEREVIELQLRQGLDPGEVATVLGVSRNHAHTVLSRAREQLGTCLAVLLVGRAGRDDCAELDAMLTGWDGRLTVLLRKRVHRHIEHCAICGARQAFELRPAMLLGLSPGAALAAGAELSFRLAADLPEAVRAHTITIATGQGAAAVAHRTAVLGRTGAFSHGGFPRPVHGGNAALAGAGRRAGGVRRVPRSSRRGQVTAAVVAVVAVVAAVAAAFALAGNTGTPRPAAGKKPPTVPAAAHTSPAATQRQTKLTTRSKSSAKPGRKPTVTTSVPRAANPTAAGSSPPPGTASPTATLSPTPTPTPPTRGTLSAYPRAGTAADPEPMVLVPDGAGRQIDLSANGRGNWDVDWSVSVAYDSGDAVSVSPAYSGTLTAADTTDTLTVTVDQFIPCGSAASPTITVNPGGAVYSVCTSLPKHYRGPAARAAELMKVGKADRQAWAARSSATATWPFITKLYAIAEHREPEPLR